MFERGRGDSTIIQTGNELLRDDVIPLAKAVLRKARALEHEHGMERTNEKKLHTFHLCGHSLEVRNRDDYIIDEMVEYFISLAQDMFHDDYDRDVARALEDPGMLFAIRALSVMGYSHVPADSLREPEETTAL